MNYAKSVTVVLTHDLNSESSVFELSGRTLSRLQNGAKERGLNYEVCDITAHEQSRFYEPSGLKHLEQHFLQVPLVPSSQEGVFFFNAANRPPRS